MHDDYLKYLEQFDLRVVHTGGDYGNFLCWALGWLDDLNYQSIEDVITENGSVHNYRDNFINRHDEYHLTNTNTTSSIVRLHYNVNDIESDILEIADTGPTVVIDPTNCILELLNNRQPEMPFCSFTKVTNVIELARAISTFQNASNQINSIEHCNLHVVKMKQLVNRPVKTLTTLCQWWKHKNSARSTKEIEESINFWQDRQAYLDQDEKILTLFRDKNPVLREKIPDIHKQKIRQHLTQLKSISSTDSIIYHDCLKQLPIQSQEFVDLLATPKVRNIYPAVFYIAEKKEKILNEIYDQVVNKTLADCNLIVHNTSVASQCLTEVLHHITDSDNLFYETSIESHNKLLEQHKININEWFGYLQTRVKNLIVIQNKNFELEDVLRTLHTVLHKESALNFANNLFAFPAHFNDAIENRNIKKILLKDIIFSPQETLAHICTWLELPMKKSIDSCNTLHPYWHVEEYKNIDHEYDNAHGGFASYAKHKKIIQHIEDYSDKHRE